jgi:hypothetical protein
MLRPRTIGVGEVVEDPLDVRPHPLRCTPARSWEALAGELVHVVPLVVVQVQDARQRFQDGRRCGDAPLLETGVIIGADRRRLGYLLPAQLRNPPRRPDVAHPDIALGQLGAPRLEERSELVGDRLPGRKLSPSRLTRPRCRRRQPARQRGRTGSLVEEGSRRRPSHPDPSAAVRRSRRARERPRFSDAIVGG